MPLSYPRNHRGFDIRGRRRTCRDAQSFNVIRSVNVKRNLHSPPSDDGRRSSTNVCRTWVRPPTAFPASSALKTIKASEERTSLANGLRESFGKLDLQRRLKDEQTQEVLSCDSNDGGRHTSSTGGTSSMSVRLVQEGKTQALLSGSMRSKT